MFFIVGIGFSKAWREEIVLTVALYNKKIYIECLMRTFSWNARRMFYIESICYAVFLLINNESHKQTNFYLI